MMLTSRTLAVVVFVLIFGGIAFSSIMGWWATESTKVPTTFTEGEFAGLSNPADIRGSYTFGDIADSFDVTPQILAQAFVVAGDDPSTFAVKDLETIYLDSGYEIGTASVRLFVAYYSGLPLDTTGQDIYLPQPAVELLLANNDLTPEQVSYLTRHTAILADPVSTSVQVTSPTSSAVTPSSEDYTVKGKTTFGELLGWGVPQAVIEERIGAPMPDPAMTLKDYASANGLDFESLKPALQAEVDKLKP